uniref:non-specific serine/threonine protein kinase n=1 Tax=Clytia hemisphaerica TaxID=252671 RepID=A0A7M5WS22_9CNID
MAEGVSSRITRLNQLLSGKTSGRKVPLLDKETLLDAFVALFNECQTDQMQKDKNIAVYVKKFKPLISEIEKLRLRKNDFEIRKTIGRGHFGEVHVVREKVTGNVYAMKVLKKSSTLSQDNVAFFEEERDIMAFANNPWITSLQYAFQDYDSLYLVMDFHPGGDLLSLLAKYDDVFEENIAKFYLGEMIMAMHAVHALGYVHRDIKPENVLIDRVGHVKLADFGSSAKLSSAKTVVSKMPVGTPEYIAPEVLMSMDGSGGGGGRYGIECDWWSLGVVAYEMMMGYTPFQADSVVVVYSQIMNFKNSLEFPDDQPLSDDAKGLIRALLTDQKERITYTGLAKHPFFTGLDWTTLQDAVPPYVPTIQREDDTSNFDDFETENSGPRLEDFMEQKKGFQGKDLPFIGFTFTKQLTLASLSEDEPSTPTQGTLPRNASVKRDSTKDASNAQVQNLMKELEKEQKKHKELQVALTEKTKTVSKVEAQYRSLENEKVLFETERKDFERQLKNEKSNREKTDREKDTLKKEVEELRNKLREETSQSNSDELNQTIQSLERQKDSTEKKNVQLEENIGEQRKMLEDSKQRVADLQAKLTKVSEDTKSNVSELQQKLLKVTADNEDRIKQFQDKLSKAMTSAEDATNQLSRVEKEKQDIEKELIEVKSYSMLNKTENDSSDDESRALQQELTSVTDENASLKKEVKQLKSDLDDSKRKYNSLVEFGEDLKAQVERKIEKLQRELANTKKESKKFEEEYKQLKQEFDDRNNNLTYKDSTIASLQASCDSLEQQLDDLMNAKELNNKQLDEKMKKERMELSRQLSEISSEKKTTESEIQNLRNEIIKAESNIETFRGKLNESNKQLEESTENFESEIQKLKRDLTKSTDETSKLNVEKDELQTTNEELENKVKALQGDLEKQRTRTVSNSKSKDSEAKVARLNVSIENLKTDKKVMETKVQKYEDDIFKSQKEKDSLQEELKEKERQANSQELTIQMLKQTCTMLEGQVEELEVMNDEYQDRETQWNMIKRQQYQAQEKLEQQLTESLNNLEQQRKIRSKAEEKLRHIEEGGSKHDLEKTVNDLETTIQDMEDKNNELAGSLSTAEKKNVLNVKTIKTLEGKLATEIEEKEKLSAEVSQLEDLSAQQTSSNFALTVEIESLKEKQEETVVEKENLENQLERTSFSHAEEKIKMESTLAQQTKLIDFLQKKVMVDDRNFAPAPKKKDKFSKGKGKTSEAASHPSTVDMRKTRDLERALEKAKNENLQLHLQLQKARDEVTNLRSELQQLKSSLRAPAASNPTTPRMSHAKLPPDAIRSSTSSLISRAGSSPSTSVADIYQMAANEVRGNGNVSSSALKNKKNDKPHHLQQTLNMRPCKCPVCLNTAPFAKQVSKCTECHLICHTKCVSSLHNMCGVSKALLSKFAMHSHRSSLILDDGSIALDVTDGQVPKLEGWLKYPRKNGTKHTWDRKWVVLEEKRLTIFDNENTIEFDPYDEVDLNIEGELNTHPAIPTSELSWAATNDLLYVFSIEILPDTLGWPRRTLYFLSPTFSDKQRWVAALEQISDDVKKSSQNGHGMAENVIMTIDNSPRDVNCAAMINPTGSVLGADDGLYVVSMKSGKSGKPVPIIGLGPVYQMEFLRDLDIALLISGKERIFCYVDISSLESRLKQLQSGSSISDINSYQIGIVKSCHLFAVAKINNEYFACAATAHKLNILKYETNTQKFILRRELETNEPCTCMLIATNYVIYGTSKFYTVDLKNYQKRDFLEASDTTLAFAVFGTSQSRNFPIAVFNVSKGKQRDEYLLCYSEFGIFVDWQGRRSRKGDLKWSRLPLAFDYRHPHLYVTHFASIEICEIFQDMKTDISSHQPNNHSLSVKNAKLFKHGWIFHEEHFSNHWK